MILYPIAHFWHFSKGRQSSNWAQVAHVSKQHSTSGIELFFKRTDRCEAFSHRKQLNYNLLPLNYNCVHPARPLICNYASIIMASYHAQYTCMRTTPHQPLLKPASFPQPQCHVPHPDVNLLKLHLRTGLYLLDHNLQDWNTFQNARIHVAAFRWKGRG